MAEGSFCPVTELNGYGQIVGSPVPNWTGCDIPPATPMLGRYCRLEPLDPARHAEDLAAGFMAAPDDRDWTWWRIARPKDAAGLRAHIADLASHDGFIFYAIIDPPTNRALGLAAYMGIDAEHGSIEVGGVHYTQSLQRHRAGTEAMFLMMQTAFDELHYRRYEWQCHSLNLPSRAAAIRLGFTLEGIFRQRLVTQGRNRDTAWHSILDSEWPALRAAFTAWLHPTNFDETGHQRKRLAELRSA